MFFINEFIADVHLGKLARLLRMLGFNTLYDNKLSNDELISIALNENRILLTRNNSVKNNAALQSFIVTHENPQTQLQQVLQYFNLKNQIRPFTKCIVCNGVLQPVSKNDIELQLSQKPNQYFTEFWQCNNCNRIYWKGSHYERMSRLIEEIKKIE